MVQDHPGTGMPHHIADFFSLFCTVAMYRTARANRFVLSEPAGDGVFYAVFKQIIAMAAETGSGTVFSSAKNTDHGPQRS